jgi:fatty acid desaturase
MAAALREPGTMRPSEDVLRDVLPTATLGPNGRPVGALRDELYSIPDTANWLHLAGIWIQSVGVIALAAWWDHPVGWLAAFLLMGRSFARFSILAHEAAHRLLFSNRALNDKVGAWLIAYPAFVPLDVYRRGHMAHHKEEFGPNEPDQQLYAGYPISGASWRRKLRRDANGNSGWKNLRGLLLALGSERARPIALRILGWQAVLFVGMWVAFGRWWIYPALWLLPWMTVWRVLNRLRAVAEHGGMTASADRRLTTHHVRQSFSARFWMVPFNTGWHLAHHVDIGVPFSKLPRLHEELERAGYVGPGLEWPSYRSLWRHASSRVGESA